MEQNHIPIFQHMIFTNKNDALECENVSVSLSQCDNCGFVFNSNFNPELMNYDENYNNEQSNSKFFQDHLNEVLNKVKKNLGQNRKVVEVGCGKGHFLELLRNNGIDCTGFDPTYEGDKDYVIKEYFSEKFTDINAELVVLRHTLEHVHHPLKLIQQIAKANNLKGKVLIEVPTFQWIYDNGAFWDVFYEHCNYFTLKTLKGFFGEAKGGYLFGGQYIYVVGDLSTVKENVNEVLDDSHFSQNPINEKIDSIKSLLTLDKTTVIWGAGGKGSTFVNLLDPKGDKIKYLVDINPAKQNKYVSVSGHHIFSPSQIEIDPPDQIIIMNPNYKDEIINSVTNKSIKFTHI
ncbi:class I SAM-dependent methyltransferase [Saprospiraceae bacterium]|nr:class I SAM-dependent methyltransferase [Saprospiraceae bacterium]